MEKILYGGDYNPEQWPQSIWEEDASLFDEASIDTLTVGVFAWSLIQKDEETYDFTVMDQIMNKLHKEGRHLCLATGTAAHPAWMARKYPDVTRVDFQGRKHKFGQRHNSCPNSPAYQKYSRKMAQKIAERYKDYDNIVAWHINNEYGGNCYCENCEAAFRMWLKEKYGTLERLNEAWNAAFWSHIMYSWEDIIIPNALSEHYGDNPNVTAFQGITLDYMRFNSDSILQNFISEKEVLKEITPDIPVTTNFMGMYRPLDYFKWAPHLDFASWDNYPPDMHSEARMALSHDLMRGLKKGQPFWLMEQTPSTTACRSSNPVKRPGVMRLWSYQALAHGSDTVLFFQMRKSKGASEKYHGAVIDHSGRNDTRVFKEVKQLGKELEVLGSEFVGGRLQAKVAFVFDWESWWAVEISDGPSRYISYQETMVQYYKAFFEQNIPVDIISVEDDLEQYEIVVAPLMHMLHDGYDKKIEKFVHEGGTFINTYLSGLVDENDNAFLMERAEPLGNVLGIRIDETDALEPEVKNKVKIRSNGNNEEYICDTIFDVIQAQGCEVIGTYVSDFYQGTPAITKNHFGSGKAWYIGTKIEDKLLKKLMGDIIQDHQLAASIPFVNGLEVTSRYKGEYRYDFLLNHTEAEIEVTIPDEGLSLLDNQSIAEGQKVVISAKNVLIVKVKLD